MKPAQKVLVVGALLIAWGLAEGFFVVLPNCEGWRMAAFNWFRTFYLPISMCGV